MSLNRCRFEVVFSCVPLTGFALVGDRKSELPSTNSGLLGCAHAGVHGHAAASALQSLCTWRQDRRGCGGLAVPKPLHQIGVCTRVQRTAFLLPREGGAGISGDSLLVGVVGRPGARAVFVAHSGHSLSWR